MSKEEVFNRLLSAHSSINMKEVQAGTFDARIQARLLTSRDELQNLHIYINDQPASPCGRSPPWWTGTCPMPTTSWTC
jgi:replicative DNA helicase